MTGPVWEPGESRGLWVMEGGVDAGGACVCNWGLKCRRTGVHGECGVSGESGLVLKRPQW